MTDGTESQIGRNSRGDLVGSAFQGKASIRELLEGHAALDRLAEEI